MFGVHARYDVIWLDEEIHLFRCAGRDAVHGVQADCALYSAVCHRQSGLHVVDDPVQPRFFLDRQPVRAVLLASTSRMTVGKAG